MLAILHVHFQGVNAVSYRFVTTSFCMCAQSVSCIWLLETLWTVACQVPLSMEISQAKILEWVAISYSRGSSPSRDRSCVSFIGRQILKGIKHVFGFHIYPQFRVHFSKFTIRYKKALLCAFDSLTYKEWTSKFGTLKYAKEFMLPLWRSDKMKKW